uniref:Uncharacterized LOC110949212 n=1 Tax=Acanthochromis polyacanthus TaxID=80966 RepID=A0A3Q1F322_9TELE
MHDISCLFLVFGQLILSVHLKVSCEEPAAGRILKHSKCSVYCVKSITPVQTMMGVRALLTASALFLQLLLAVSSAVKPSTCRAVWIFKLPCSEPVNVLVKEVKAWSTKKCLDGQEKCMYQLINESPSHLEIQHTSPSTYKTTELTIDFSPPAAPSFCRMRSRASTTSLNTTSPNDFCLLYNLVEGSGLTEAEGYKEICNNAMCPAKETAKCDKGV